MLSMGYIFGITRDRFLLVPPVLSGVTPEDQTLTVGDGGGSVDVPSEPWFTGQSLVYSLISPPAGCTINAVTGVVTISTLVVLALSSLVVRAANIGGHLDVEIDVQVSL